MSDASDGPALSPEPLDEPASVDPVVFDPALGLDDEFLVPDEPADTRVVVVRDVIKTFPTPTGSIVALDGVELDVAGRGLHVVAGAAGAGVTTLLALIACLDRPDAGQVWVAGVDTSKAKRSARRELRRRALGIVQSDPACNLLPGMAAGANIAWAAKRRTGAALNAAGVDAHLEMAGLTGAGRTRVGALTGGEQQRLALACALAGEPRLVVADDPTVTLDREEAMRFVNALRDAADRGVCVLAGSSDPLVVAAADELTRLVEGRMG